jgi:proton-translocating NADH-quinone oxidoreductase chain M
MGINYLVLILLIIIFTILYIFIEQDLLRIKKIGLFNSFILLLLSSFLWINFDISNFGYQYEKKIILFEKLNIIYYIGVDGISLFFILLTILLLPICLLCSWTTITYRVKEFYLLLYIITLLLINVFCVLDLLLFYIFFESVLIPMFLIIGIWGSRDRKIHAAYQFFVYTLLGSVIMLLGIIYIYINVGSLNIYEITNYNYTINEGRLLWIAFFASFAVKVPMIPVHIWLPEAHVEAPTAGSVLLAGILLKMGTYGLLRFSLPMFVEATYFYQPFVFLISIISIIYGACTTIRQTDLKKVIAYSSVVHMNYVMLGILSCNIYGLEGSIFLMLSHGLVSSALFLSVGLIYERYHTRMILYYGGLVYSMPIFSVLFFLLTLANISLPGTSSFIGEFLILVSIYSQNTIVLLFSLIGIILGAVYAIWFCNKLIFGVGNSKFLNVYIDLNSREILIILLCLILSILFGIFPNLILENLHSSVLLILDK